MNNNLVTLSATKRTDTYTIDDIKYRLGAANNTSYSNESTPSLTFTSLIDMGSQLPSRPRTGCLTLIIFFRALRLASLLGLNLPSSPSCSYWTRWFMLFGIMPLGITACVAYDGDLTYGDCQVMNTELILHRKFFLV
ncbi:hypothetical protein CEXT_774331 [Caerostris extrusa]|uniref:Uncharacterized protein n=1 Tax=Caerostris extrusa TaxID=172846 RepID=A0AAV4NJQ2_CAEEX|nr:hypothetical protein CEXT_774331 [Caerostris extrusa]